MLTKILASGAVAGLVAGIMLGILLLSIMTPLILQAEKFESYPGKQTLGPSQGRYAGTILGSIILGTAYGLIMAVVWNGLKKNKKSKRPLVEGLVFGGIGFVVAVLVPSLGFMPNPPGVQTKYPVSTRQLWWLAIIGLELVCLWMYRAMIGSLLKKGSSLARAGIFSLVAFVPLAVPFSIGLPNQIKETSIPDVLLLEFRLGSLAVMLIFWLLLGSSISFTYNWLIED